MIKSFECIANFFCFDEHLLQYSVDRELMFVGNIRKDLISYIRIPSPTIASTCFLAVLFVVVGDVRAFRFCGAWILLQIINDDVSFQKESVNDAHSFKGGRFIGHILSSSINIKAILYQ